MPVKPCPFCGAQPSHNEIAAHTHSPMLKAMGVPDHPGSHVIECGCGVGMIDDTFEAALERWNRRASPFQRPGRIGEKSAPTASEKP